MGAIHFDNITILKTLKTLPYNVKGILEIIKT
jgi:hypothetical protein